MKYNHWLFSQPTLVKRDLHMVLTQTSPTNEAQLNFEWLGVVESVQQMEGGMAEDKS